MSQVLQVRRESQESQERRVRRERKETPDHQGKKKRPPTMSFWKVRTRPFAPWLLNGCTLYECDLEPWLLNDCTLYECDLCATAPK